MARYKVLPSIAHNFGQSFVGASNERADDHLLGRLLADARRTGEATLRLDILGGEATPACSSAGRSRGFSTATSGTFRNWCLAATRTCGRPRRADELIFDLATERAVLGAGDQRESPFLCRVAIDDDRGKTWIAELRGWCAPERPGLFARAAGRLTS